MRCINGIFGREVTKYTAIYGVYMRFWPTLIIWFLAGGVCFESDGAGRAGACPVKVVLLQPKEKYAQKRFQNALKCSTPFRR
jgi:hypothetical protein